MGINAQTYWLSHYALDFLICFIFLSISLTVIFIYETFHDYAYFIFAPESMGKFSLPLSHIELA